MIHAKDHRRPSPRRMAPVRRKAKGQAGHEATRGRSQGSATGARTPLARTSTGLLIPQLAPGVPTSYAGDTKGAADIIRGMVAVGALTPRTRGECEQSLIQLGVENMLPPSLKKYERGYGDYVSLSFDEDRIGCSINQECHTWVLKLKPIVTAMPPDEALAFIKCLNKSVVQGPWFWDEMVGWADQITAEDEGKKQVPTEPVFQGNTWLAKLLEQHPCLKEEPAQPTLMDVLAPLPKRETPPELRTLIDEFDAANRDVDPYVDDAALCCTSWSHDCYIRHAHDRLLHEIHEGNMDGQDGQPFAFSVQSVAELNEALTIIGRFVEAVYKLEEWSNAAG